LRIILRNFATKDLLCAASPNSRFFAEFILSESAGLRMTGALMAEPKSTKPYLLRAMYEWCVDNGYTPHISVVVDSRTRVPMEYVRNGEIVLNVGPVAASRLRMGNELIECTARFSGIAQDLVIPVATVAAIYAGENGQGMSFEPGKEETAERASSEEVAAPPGPKDPPKTGGKPALRRIK
jgi:stringent starvation protein B